MNESHHGESRGRSIIPCEEGSEPALTLSMRRRKRQAMVKGREMQGSVERVKTLIDGGIPDRPPLYDIFRNDAVISHFAGTKLTVDNGDELIFKAYAQAVDATRPTIRGPQKERTEIFCDGREHRIYRWTSWTTHRRYADSKDYEQTKRKILDTFDSSWTPNDEANQRQFLNDGDSARKRLGDVFFFPSVPNQGLTELYSEVGLNDFSYYMLDCPDIILELLEIQTIYAVNWAEHLPNDNHIMACFCGDDIAFHSGPLFSPVWLKEHLFPRLARVISAYHRKGIKVMFHSDGNLNPILDDLVEAGIDGLNPIEILAGMDVGEIHKRYPHLFMAGGIDVSQLLSFGTPVKIKDAVKKAIDDAQGRLMVGSSTEIHSDVPLINYLALHDTVLEAVYSYK